MATLLKRSKFQSFTKEQKEDEETLEFEDDITCYFAEYIEDDSVQMKHQTKNDQEINQTTRVEVVSPKAMRRITHFFDDE